MSSFILGLLLGMFLMNNMINYNNEHEKREL